MKAKSGAVFFVVCGYTDEDGGLSIAKSVIHLCTSLCRTILKSRKGMKRVILDLWQRNRNTGKVRIIYSTCGPSLWKVSLPFFV